MSKYTFEQFIAAQEGDDFNNIELSNLEWAIGFVESMGKSGKWIHEGDCTKQNVSCPLCVYELYLKEYREYYFSTEPQELDEYSKSTLMEAYGMPAKFHRDIVKLNKKEELDFIKRCIDVYWEHYANSSHEDNLNDWNISQNILKK
jgi:hypothetical protein